MKLTLTIIALLLARTADAGVGGLRVNGVEMQLQQFSVPGAQLASLKSRRWSVTGGDERSREVLLARQRGTVHEVLRLRPIPGTGRVAVLATAIDLSVPPRPVRLTPVPLPAGSRLTSVVEPLQVDGATSYSGYCAGSANHMQSYFSRQAHSLGWRELPPQWLPARAGSLHWWSRGRELLALTLIRLPAGCRFVLLHERRAEQVRAWIDEERHR